MRVISLLALGFSLGSGCKPFPDRQFPDNPDADFDGDGFAEEDGDCDDESTGAFPYGPEYCDGADNDCDGNIDEDDAVDATAWYLDVDGDEYGSDIAPVTACSPRNGYVAAGADCDDSDPRRESRRRRGLR